MKRIIFLTVCFIFCHTTSGQETDSRILDLSTNQSLPIPDGRIVGGERTEIEKFPYQISLSNSRSHSCGGSILSNRIVVTAAHCVKGKRPQQLSIRAGSSQHNSGGIVVPVQKVIVHPNYNSNTMDRDIALLLLSKVIPFSSAIQSIEIASPGADLTANAALIVSGWGATNEGSRASAFLRFTQVQFISKEICSKSYRSSGGISSNMFCAGVVGGGRDSCQGDSGGPLVTYNGNKPILHGIVSWGYGCARPKYPGVYTKVSNMNEWIKRNMNSLQRLQ